MLSPGSDFAGYRIEAVAGRGGMGIVYRARQIMPERVVALKAIAPEAAGDESFRERFKRESQLAAAIEHQNVIPVYEVGEAEGVLFIAMRFVDGTDLGTLIDSGDGRGMPPAEAAYVVAQVGAALDAAHARGLVHRDVKPANILIAGGPGERHAYLTDFGLAKAADSQTGLTSSGIVVGTVDYIAPEQVRGERLDARTDVYALGCVLFKALTGRVPYLAEATLAKMYAHAHEPVPSVLEARPDLPPELDAVVRRAMAKDPADRYPSAGDLGRAARAAAISAPTAPPSAERNVARGEAAPPPTTMSSRPANQVQAPSAPSPASEPSAPAAEPSASMPSQPPPPTGPRHPAPPSTTRLPATGEHDAPRGRRPLLLAAAALVAVLAIVGIVLAVGGGGDGGGDDGGGSSNASNATGGDGSPETARIGVQAYTEQRLLGSMYKQALEAKGFPVEVSEHGDSWQGLDKALVDGEIDAYPAYIGEFAYGLGDPNANYASAEETHLAAQKIAEGRDEIVSTPSPMSTQAALATTSQFADENNLNSIADLADLDKPPVVGAQSDFEGSWGRQIKELYGIDPTYKDIESTANTFEALDAADIDVAAIYTTDGELARGDYRVLDDPKHVFGYENVAVVASKPKADAAGSEFAGVVDSVNAALSNDAMQQMNSAVDGEGKSVDEVARSFLETQGLL